MKRECGSVAEGSARAVLVAGRSGVSGLNRMGFWNGRRLLPALAAALVLAALGGSSTRIAAEEIPAVEPPFGGWEEDELFEGGEPFLHDSDPSWAEEDPGLEGYEPLFPPLAPWDLDEPSLEEPTFAEPDLLEST